MPDRANDNVYSVDLCVYANILNGSGRADENASISVKLQKQTNNEWETIATAEIEPSLLGDQISIATVRLDSTNAMNLRAKVAFNNFIGEVQIKGITVSPHKKATTAQMIKTTDDVEFGFSQLQTISFTVGDKAYSNVAFTARDSMLTLISYMKNSQCFNLWYNDGNNVVLGVDMQNLNFSPTLASIFSIPIVKRIYKNESITKYEYVLPINFIDNKCDLQFHVLFQQSTAKLRDSILH